LEYDTRQLSRKSDASLKYTKACIEKLDTGELVFRAAVPRRAVIAQASD
jgi:hypothetical protein